MENRKKNKIYAIRVEKDQTTTLNADYKKSCREELKQNVS